MAYRYLFNFDTEKLDIVQDVSGFVPYTGATGDVDLGAFDLTATDLTATGTTYTNTVNSIGESSLNLRAYSGYYVRSWQTLLVGDLEFSDLGAYTTIAVENGAITQTDPLSIVSNSFGASTFRNDVNFPNVKVSFGDLQFVVNGDYSYIDGYYGLIHQKSQVSGMYNEFTNSVIYNDGTAPTSSTKLSTSWTLSADWKYVYLFATTPPTTLPAVGDTYTNNGQTFTFVYANTAKNYLYFTGTGAPTSSGTLVRATGSGSTPITFSGSLSGVLHYTDGTGTAVNNMLTAPVVNEVYYSYITVFQHIGSVSVSLGGTNPTGLQGLTTTNSAWSRAFTTDQLTLTPTTQARIFIGDNSYVKRATDGNFFVAGEQNTGSLRVCGRVINNITIVTDTYDILTTDYTVICNKATNFTVTLPTAVVGQTYNIKNVNTGIVTIEGNGTDTIDDELTQQINQWDCINLQCYIANKWVIM